MTLNHLDTERKGIAALCLVLFLAAYSMSVLISLSETAFAGDHCHAEETHSFDKYVAQSKSMNDHHTGEGYDAGCCSLLCSAISLNNIGTLETPAHYATIYQEDRKTLSSVDEDTLQRPPRIS